MLRCQPALEGDVTLCLIRVARQVFPESQIALLVDAARLAYVDMMSPRPLSRLAEEMEIR